LSDKLSKDPSKVGWDMMTAFGSDEYGHQFLEAVVLHCTPLSGDAWLEAVVQNAKTAFRESGFGMPGKRAAWTALEDAGLNILPDMMDAIGVNRSHGPRAAFFYPLLDKAFIVSYNWQIIPAD
jgi:hypothetical protein